MASYVEVEEIHKRFGGVHAVRGVTLGFDRGEVTGLVGENGAGKSTIGKILGGVIQPDSGSLRINGEEARLKTPRHALRAGIAVITQELAVLPKRSVIENVFLGAENARYGVVSKAALEQRYLELVALTRFEIPGDMKVNELRPAQRIQIEVMRAIARNAAVIVMDEVTAALSFDEAGRLFELVRTLSKQRTAIVYISHFLHEILDLVDQVHVLRDGMLVKTSLASEETTQSLVTAMVGRSLDLAFPTKRPVQEEAPVVCDIQGITRRGIVEEVSLSVRAGEIVGIAGLIGSGRSEFARAVFGADRRDSGTVEVNGSVVEIKAPRDAIRAGIGMVPESRKEQGLMMRRSIIENVTLPHLHGTWPLGVLRRRKEEAEVAAITARLAVRAASLNVLAETLSGGNQQKVLFAKWLLRPPRFLIADEPTRGVDVAAKRQIYDLIARLATEGLGVLLISSELEEVINLAHRVLVMRQGRIVAEFHGGGIIEEEVMAAAFGIEKNEMRTGVTI